MNGSTWTLEIRTEEFTNRSMISNDREALLRYREAVQEYGVENVSITENRWQVTGGSSLNVEANVVDFQGILHG